MSLFSAAERFASIDRSIVVLDGASCLHSHDKFSGCEACFNICPAGAIAPGKPPALDAEKCKNCFACLAACPVGAYAADDAVVHLLNAAARLENAALELICEKNPHPEIGHSQEITAVRVPGCLAGLGSGTYLSLAAMGLEAIHVRLDGCRDCAWKNLSDFVVTQVESAQGLLLVWGKGNILQRVDSLDTPSDRPLWEAKNPPLSRRDMFRVLAQQGKVAVARAIEKDRTLAHGRLGRDRLRLLGAIKHLPAPTRIGDVKVDKFGFASLSVSDECTACAVCARACPTGALSFETDETGSEFTLRFSAQLCVSCDLCQRVCLPSAITIDASPTFDGIFKEETIVLKSGGIARCKGCGAPIAVKPGVTLCSFCRQRKEHPFGSMLTPEMRQRFTHRPEDQQ